MTYQLFFFFFFNWYFRIVVLEKTLRVPWTAKRSNQVILKEINPEYSLEGLMLELQHFGHPMRRTDSLEKTLMLAKTEGKRRGWQRLRWLDTITDSTDMNLSKLWETVKDRRVWHAAVHGVAKSRTRLSSWTTTKCQLEFVCALQLGDVFDHVCCWKGSSTCDQAPIVLTHYVNCPLTAGFPDFWIRL